MADDVSRVATRSTPSHRARGTGKLGAKGQAAPKGKGGAKGRQPAKREPSATSKTGPKASREQRQTTRRPDGKERTPVSPKLRRRRFILAVSVAFAAVVLGTSFPASGLLSQHRQLSSTTAAIHRLQAENTALAEEQQQLNSKAEIHSLARKDYQLVDPGQTAYNVLPPGTQTTKPSSAVIGDPGNQPLVAPAHAAGMSPDPEVPTTTTPAAAGGQTPSSAGSGTGATTPTTQPTATSGGFWTRTLHSLEFWR